MFRNRQDAGRQLGETLAARRLARPVILGLPRGGVVVAAEVARALGGELDVVLVKKLRAPGNPELAVGAVAEDGRYVVNNVPVREDYLAAERQARLAEMEQQRQLYRAVKPRLPVTGRDVVLVDDGLATGATMSAAVQTTALLRPAQLLVAAPVGPLDTVEQFLELDAVTDVVCLMTPVEFEGVGQFYLDFRQVSDAEVVALLRGQP
jgi:predicted phosphoribosyltransferase